jgi:hypothetical protein
MSKHAKPQDVQPQDSACSLSQAGRVAYDSPARAASNIEVGVPTAFVAKSSPLISQKRTKAHLAITAT